MRAAGRDDVVGVGGERPTETSVPRRAMTANTYVKTLDGSEARELEALLRTAGFEFRDVAHALFSARGEGVTCTVYTSGKCVVQGPGLEGFVAERLKSAVEAPAPSGLLLEFPDKVVGSDETGKGDYFGPLVTCAVAFDASKLGHFAEDALVDSKTLSESAVKRIAAEIRQHLVYKEVVILPERYNQIYQTFGNLNRMLAWAHATAIEGVLEQTEADVALVDKFCDESVLRRYLKERGKTKKLVMRPKLEAHPAVAAASIIASDTFTRSLLRLGREVGLVLPKGAGSPVDSAAKRLVSVNGEAVLQKVAKLHFKTTEKVLGHPLEPRPEAP